MHLHRRAGEAARGASEIVLTMHETRHHRCKLHSGVTLLETIIVLAIIAGVLALLLPAVQRARTAARDKVCQNNLYQIADATTHLWSARKKLPISATPNHVSGWAIAILPFLEEKSLWEQISNEPETTTVKAIVSRRPQIYSCPNGWEGDSNLPSVPASHYTMTIFRKPENFEVKDVPIDFRIPWPESPEGIATPLGQGPHDSGYYLKRNFGDAKWIEK
jgi:type II secretory pathway pseudopilin PulG